MTATLSRPVAAPMSMQGIAIPAAHVDSNAFRALTRRHIQQEARVAFTLGQNTTDPIPLRRSDILSEVTLRITGTLVITPGTGSVGSTWKWPYGLLKSVKFNANGATSLIAARGWTLKAREYAKDEGLSDRGVPNRTINGATVNSGSLSLGSESWGVGQGTPGLSGTAGVPIDLVLTIPVAEDQYDLSGAIFLQSSSSELSVVLEWANPTDLFTLAGNATVALSGYVEVQSTKFKIPAVDGAIVVPDLSQFHSLVETSTPAIANGENEPIVVGQGAGKYVLRIIEQLESNGAPLSVNSTNFGLMGYRYGTSETPDQWANGSQLRYNNERNYNTDLGTYQGFWVHEFAKAGFRDVLDMGVTADLRTVVTVPNGVTLTAPKLWYAVESLYASGQAA
jgi:hypothetical protein